MSSVAQLFARWLLHQATQPSGTLRALTIEAVDDLRDRGALLALESRSDVERAVRWLLVAMFGCLAGFTSLSWLSAAAILLAWDTAHRDLAIIVVAGAWVCVAAFCIGWLRVSIARATPPLSRSRQLFADDLALLRRTLQESHT